MTGDEDHHSDPGTGRDVPVTRPKGGRDSPSVRDDRDGSSIAGKHSTGAVDPSRLGAEPTETVRSSETAAVAGGPVTAETDAVAATLVALPLVDVRELAYTHRMDRSRLERGETIQPVALFDLHNVGGFPVQWVSSRAQFVGDDGYTYQPAQLSIDPEQLGPGIHTRRVEIRPDRRARIATLVEQLPAGVEIVEVAQTVSIRAGSTDTEQLVFSLAE